MSVLAVTAVSLLVSCDTSMDSASNDSAGPAWDTARTSADGRSIVIVFTGGQEYDPSNHVRSTTAQT